MDLIIYVADNCSTCERIINNTKALLTRVNSVELIIKKVDESPENVSIVPAIFLEDTLLFYGDFDTEKLLAYIHKGGNK